MTLLLGGRRRGPIWTPADLVNLAAWYSAIRASQTLNNQGPLWPSQGSHARGLEYNGVDNTVNIGTPLYDHSSIAFSYTFLTWWPTSNTGIKSYYSEGNSADGKPLLYFIRNGTNTFGIVLRDDTQTGTIGAPSNRTVSVNQWNIVTVVLDTGGHGYVVNGDEKLTLGTAYSNAPAQTTLDRCIMGALGRTGDSNHWDQTIAFGIRHTAALTLAQARQVQQYIADAVDAELGTITITGSETADSNSPYDEWRHDEDADGKELANSGSQSTIGERLPGDTISGIDDLGPNDDDMAQATEAIQPKYLTDGIAAGKPSITGFEELDTTIEAIFTSTLTQPFVVAVAYRCDSWGSGRYLYADNDSHHIRIYNASGTVYMRANGTSRALGTPAEMEGTHVLICVFDGASSKAYLDGGASLVSASPGTGGLSGLTFMSDNAGGANTHLAGSISNGVVNDGTLTAELVNNLGNYLAGKLGSSWTAIS